jgi:hypothetical protein
VSSSALAVARTSLRLLKFRAPLKAKFGRSWLLGSGNAPVNAALKNSESNPHGCINLSECLLCSKRDSKISRIDYFSIKSASNCSKA